MFRIAQRLTLTDRAMQSIRVLLTNSSDKFTDEVINSHLIIQTNIHCDLTRTTGRRKYTRPSSNEDENHHLLPTPTTQDIRTISTTLKFPPVSFFSHPKNDGRSVHLFNYPQCSECVNESRQTPTPTNFNEQSGTFETAFFETVYVLHLLLLSIRMGSSTFALLLHTPHRNHQHQNKPGIWRSGLGRKDLVPCPHLYTDLQPGR